MVSKHERLCRNVIEAMTEHKFPTVRPDFLQNPRTKHNLELDGYNEKLGIAFEAQGRQHYEHKSTNTHFFKSDEDWKKQLIRDDYKKRVCKLLGVNLIIIPHKTNSIESIYNRIIRKANIHVHTLEEVKALLQ